MGHRIGFERHLRKRTVITIVVFFVLFITTVITVFLWQQGTFSGGSSGSEIVREENKKIGNTSGNISNSGMYAKDGDWIYYRNYSDDKKLYRMKSDGSNNTKVCDDEPFYINVLDDWIYYISSSEKYNLCKIKTNGEDKCYLNSFRTSSVNVSEGWIYYVASSGESSNAIWKCRLDGSEKTLLSYDQSYWLFMDSKWLYFTLNNSSDESDENSNAIYRMDFNGENRQKIGRGKDLCIEDGYIYYSNLDDEKKLYRMRADGSEKEKICEDSAGSINVSGEWIYYLNWNEDWHAYCIKNDGSGRKKLFERTSYGFNIVGEWVYFCSREDPEDFRAPDEIFRMKLEGTELEKL